MLDFKTKLLALLVVAACVATVEMAGMPGGLGEEVLADDEVRAVIERVRESIQARYPEPFTRVEPISYRTQVVSGRNYFIKVIFHETDGDKIVAHLRIYKGFRGNVELHGMKLKVKHDDPIKHFK